MLMFLGIRRYGEPTSIDLFSQSDSFNHFLQSFSTRIVPYEARSLPLMNRSRNTFGRNEYKTASAGFTLLGTPLPGYVSSKSSKRHNFKYDNNSEDLRRQMARQQQITNLTGRPAPANSNVVILEKNISAESVFGKSRDALIIAVDPEDEEETEQSNRSGEDVLLEKGGQSSIPNFEYNGSFPFFRCLMC
jgi:hypothetical protein